VRHEPLRDCRGPPENSQPFPRVRR